MCFPRRYEWYDIENTPRTKFVKDFEMSIRHANNGGAKKDVTKCEFGTSGWKKRLTPAVGMTEFRLSEREIDKQ